jgi:uncharacterized protein (DUF427 family)
MTLTSGRGPFSGQRQGVFFPPLPERVVYVEPLRRRVRGVRAGRTVIDSEEVLLVHRSGHPPAYGFPAPHVRDCPVIEVPEVPGVVTVPWDAVDAWYEEEEQVFLHPRNPYHRVDYLPSRRRLRVEVAGETLVDTDRTVVAYETALEPVPYVPKDVVRMELLVPSATTSYCPYKGTASWWSAVVGDAVIGDVAWSYEDPRPESSRIRGMMAFDPARATVVHDVPPGAVPGVRAEEQA